MSWLSGNNLFYLREDKSEIPYHKDKIEELKQRREEAENDHTELNHHYSQSEDHAKELDDLHDDFSWSLGVEENFETHPKIAEKAYGKDFLEKFQNHGEESGRLRNTHREESEGAYDGVHAYKRALEHYDKAINSHKKAIKHAGTSKYKNHAKDADEFESDADGYHEEADEHRGVHWSPIDHDHLEQGRELLKQGEAGAKRFDKLSSEAADYHEDKKSEHYDAQDHHYNILNYKILPPHVEDAHNKAIAAHDKAADDHRIGSDDHTSDYPYNHEIVEKAEKSSEKAHKLSEKANKIHKEHINKTHGKHLAHHNKMIDYHKKQEALANSKYKHAYDNDLPTEQHWAIAAHAHHDAKNDHTEAAEEHKNIISRAFEKDRPADFGGLEAAAENKYMHDDSTKEADELTAKAHKLHQEHTNEPPPGHDSHEDYHQHHITNHMVDMQKHHLILKGIQRAGGQGTERLKKMKVTQGHLQAHNDALQMHQDNHPDAAQHSNDLAKKLGHK